ncbi:hypothetical protein GBA52_003660 [Prunus armeniaca]|nr:hypothetical protein GBA52_003660 [Prunus armeniaca]
MAVDKIFVLTLKNPLRRGRENSVISLPLLKSSTQQIVPSCQLAFTRLRDKELTYIDSSGDGRFKFFEDVAQIKDKMYAVTHSWSLLFAFEYTNQCSSYLKTIAQGYKIEEFMKTYLVGSNEKQLLLVRRYMNYEICGCVTKRFRVFELNFDKHEWIEKNDLGSVEARSLRVVIHYLPDSPILHSYLRSSTLQPPLDCFVADRTNKDKEKSQATDKSKKTKMSSSVGNQVRASHILIKHQGSRRKASWKDPEGAIIKNTTRDSAVSQLKALHDDIISGKAKFDDLASRYSDCSSAKRGGDLGPFGKGQMQKPFEEATFALKVGEISDIVDTDSGVHIIMRTG